MNLNKQIATFLYAAESNYCNALGKIGENPIPPPSPLAEQLTCFGLKLRKHWRNLRKILFRRHRHHRQRPALIRAADTARFTSYDIYRFFTL